MTPERMAEIHARAMTIPPPWSAPTFAGFLAAPGAVLTFEQGAFALGRVVADEAELLTIAVHPEVQRTGLGRRCLEAFLAASHAAGARRAFLEVARTNTPARALYRSLGFAEDGIRNGYYRREGHEAVDAILMSTALDQA